MRFTDTELGLIKSLFADNDELLYAIRKVMFQFETTDQEKETIKRAINDSTLALLYKVFLPGLDPDAPIHQMADIVLGLGVEIKSLSPDGAWPFIKAKEVSMDYLGQQLKALNGNVATNHISLTELSDISGPKTQREQKYINVIARNFILSFIDSMFQQIQTLAGKKEESVEQTLARLAQNSAK